MGVILIIGFVQAIIFGSFCAYVASQKRRDAGAWFMLGLLFSILALLAIAVVPTETAPVSGGQSDQGSYARPCPFCKERVHEAATVCPHCQRDLPPVEGKCTYCGAIVNSGEGLRNEEGVLFCSPAHSKAVSAEAEAVSASSTDRGLAEVIQRELPSTMVLFQCLSPGSSGAARGRCCFIITEAEFLVFRDIGLLWAKWRLLDRCPLDDIRGYSYDGTGGRLAFSTPQNEWHLDGEAARHFDTFLRWALKQRAESRTEKHG